ncbi:MAG: type II toxin-antitoxin system Phd/YefM family antitoxin [Nitrococcus sp.]|nr:type II toxin-antitoxin system Phd/YefM family antitoxin [Nitrococcus sp.]
MKTITAVEAKNKFGQLIEAAQRQPVRVTKKGRASVVVMSIEDYERRKKRAWKNLIKAMDETGGYAVSQGLTPARLERLLADES